MKKIFMAVAGVVFMSVNALAAGAFKAIKQDGSSTLCDTLQAAVTYADDGGTVELQSDATWDTSITLTDKRVTITSAANHKYILKRANSTAGFVVDAGSAAHTPDSDYTDVAEDKDGFFGNNRYCYETARLTLKNVIVDGGAVWMDASNPKIDTVATGSITGGQLVQLKAGAAVSGSTTRGNLSGLKLENAEIRNFKTDSKYMITSGGNYTAFRMNPGSKISNCRGTHGVYSASGTTATFVFLRILEAEITGCKVSNTSAAVLYYRCGAAYTGWNFIRIRDSAITGNIAGNDSYGVVYSTRPLPFEGLVVIKDNFLSDGTTAANVRTSADIDLHGKLADGAYIGLKRGTQKPAADVAFGTATYVDDDANASAFHYDGNPYDGINWVGRVSGTSVVWKDATIPDPGDDGEFWLTNPGETSVKFKNLAKAFAAAKNDAVIELGKDSKYHNAIAVTNRVTLTSAAGYSYTLTRSDAAQLSIQRESDANIGELTIGNLTIDGGAVWTNPNKIEDDTATGIGACDFVTLYAGADSGTTTKIYLKSGAVIRNFKTSKTLFATDGKYQVIDIEDGALVTDCRGSGRLISSDGKSTRVVLNGGTITRCSTTVDTYGLIYLNDSSVQFEIGGVAITNNYVTKTHASQVVAAVTYAGSKSLTFTGGKTIIRDNFYVNGTATKQMNFAYAGNDAAACEAAMRVTALVGPMAKGADVRVGYPLSGTVDNAGFMTTTYTARDTNPRAFRYNGNPVDGTNYVGKISSTSYLVWEDETKEEEVHDLYNNFRVSNNGGETWTTNKSLKGSISIAKANAIIEVIDDPEAADDYAELWQPITVEANGITLRSEPGKRHKLVRTGKAGFSINTTGCRMTVTNLVIDAGAVWATKDVGDPTEDETEGGKAGTAVSLFTVGLGGSQDYAHGYDLLDVEIKNFNGSGGSAVVDVSRGTVKLGAGTFIHDCRCGTDSLSRGAIVRAGSGGGYNTCVRYEDCSIYSNGCARVHLAASNRGMEYFGNCSIYGNWVYDYAVRPAVYADVTTYGCHFTGGKTVIWDNYNRLGARADFYPLSEEAEGNPATTVTVLDGVFATGSKVGVCYPEAGAQVADTPFAVNKFDDYTTNPAGAFYYEYNPVGGVTYVGYVSGETVKWKNEKDIHELEQENAFRYKNPGDKTWTKCGYLQQAFKAAKDGAIIEVLKPTKPKNADAKYNRNITLKSGTVTLRSETDDKTGKTKGPYVLARIEAVTISVANDTAEAKLVVSDLTLSGGANWTAPKDLYSLAQGTDAVGQSDFFIVGVSTGVSGRYASLTLGSGVTLKDVYSQTAAINIGDCGRLTMQEGATLTGIRGGRAIYTGGSGGEVNFDGGTITLCASPTTGLGLRSPSNEVFFRSLTVTGNLARGYPFVDAYGEDESNGAKVHFGGGKLVIKDNLLHLPAEAEARAGNLRLAAEAEVANVLFDGAVDETSDVHVYGNAGAHYGSAFGTVATTAANVHPERFFCDTIADGAYGGVSRGLAVWVETPTTASFAAMDSDGKIGYYATFDAALAACADYGALGIIGPDVDSFAVSGRHLKLDVYAGGFAGDIVVGDRAELTFDGRGQGKIGGTITVNGKGAELFVDGGEVGSIVVVKGSALVNDTTVNTIYERGGSLQVEFSNVNNALTASGPSSLTLGFGNNIPSKSVADSVTVDDYTTKGSGAVYMKIDGGAETAYASFDAAIDALKARTEATRVEIELRDSNASFSKIFNTYGFKQDIDISIRSASTRRVLSRTKAADCYFQVWPEVTSYRHTLRFDNVVLDGGAVWTNPFHTNASKEERDAMCDCDGVKGNAYLFRCENNPCLEFGSGAEIRNVRDNYIIYSVNIVGKYEFGFQDGFRMTGNRVLESAVQMNQSASAKISVSGGRYDRNFAGGRLFYAIGDGNAASDTGILFTGGKVSRNLTTKQTIYPYALPCLLKDVEITDNVIGSDADVQRAVVYSNIEGARVTLSGHPVVRSNSTMADATAGLYLNDRPSAVDGVLDWGAYVEVHGKDEVLREGGQLSSAGMTCTLGSSGFDHIVSLNDKTFVARSDGAGGVVWGKPAAFTLVGDNQSLVGNVTAGTLKFQLDGAFNAGKLDIAGNVSLGSDAIVSVGAPYDVIKSFDGAHVGVTLLTASDIIGTLPALALPDGWHLRTVETEGGRKALRLLYSSTGGLVIFVKP